MTRSRRGGLILVLGGLAVVVLGPVLLLVLLPLALWRDWGGARSWLTRTIPPLRAVRPGLLALGVLTLFLAGGVLARPSSAGRAGGGGEDRRPPLLALSPSPPPAPTLSPPRVPTPSPTPSPIPSPLPTVRRSPTPARLGVSRREIQGLYERLGFTFTDYPLATGEPAVRGDPPDRLDWLEIDGPPENIRAVTLQVVVPHQPDLPPSTLKELLLLADWGGDAPWVADHLAEAWQGRAVRDVLADRVIRLSADQAQRTITLSVEAR